MDKKTIELQISQCLKDPELRWIYIGVLYIVASNSSSSNSLYDFVYIGVLYIVAFKFLFFLFFKSYKLLEEEEFEATI